jgi:hypothetical protein
MQSLQFWVVGIAGVLTLFLFCWLLFWRKREFDAALLGLLTLSYLLLGIAMIQPDTIKYAGLEISTIKQEGIAINEKAKDSVKLSLETVAMLTWNAGRFDSGGKRNEEIATNLLRELYGDRALPYRYALQRQGLWVTPKSELEKVPNVPFPQDIRSPLYDMYLKNLEVVGK